MCFPIYNNVYPKYYQGQDKDVYQWNQQLCLWKLLNQLDSLKKAVIIKLNTWKEKTYCCLLTNKLIGKVPDGCNAKEHYQSFLRKQNRKSVKQSEIITYNQKLLKTQIVLI